VAEPGLFDDIHFCMELVRFFGATRPCSTPLDSKRRCVNARHHRTPNETQTATGKVTW
jgi:hypothetical protein